MGNSQSFNQNLGAAIREFPHEAAAAAFSTVPDIFLASFIAGFNSCIEQAANTRDQLDVIVTKIDQIDPHLEVVAETIAHKATIENSRSAPEIDTARGNLQNMQELSQTLIELVADSSKIDAVAFGRQAGEQLATMLIEEASEQNNAELAANAPLVALDAANYISTTLSNRIITNSASAALNGLSNSQQEQQTIASAGKVETLLQEAASNLVQAVQEKGQKFANYTQENAELLVTGRESEFATGLEQEAKRIKASQRPGQKVQNQQSNLLQQNKIQQIIIPQGVREALRKMKPLSNNPELTPITSPNKGSSKDRGPTK